MKELNKLVLLEGIEGSGKTTFSQRLRNNGWEAIHFQYWKGGNPLQYWFDSMHKALINSGKNNLVVDRLYISNRVYEELAYGIPSINDFQAWLIDGWLQCRGGLICHMNSIDAKYTSNRVFSKFGNLISVDDIKNKFYDELHKRDVNIRYDISAKDHDVYMMIYLIWNRSIMSILMEV